MSLLDWFRNDHCEYRVYVSENGEDRVEVCGQSAKHKHDGGHYCTEHIDIVINIHEDEYDEHNEGHDPHGDHGHNNPHGK